MRLSFLLLLGFSANCPVARAPSSDAPKFHVNTQRLQTSLEKLSEFGRNPDGGVTRLGYSDTELAARQYVRGLMEQAGLTIRTDAAGNLFGGRAGLEKLPVLFSALTSTPCSTAESLTAMSAASAQSK